MNISTHKSQLTHKRVLIKSLALFSLLALIATPLMASAITYAPPITINNPTPAVGEYFGSSVSISGDKMLVGAHQDGTGAYDVGVAYLYDVTTGTLLHTLNNPTPVEHDQFGASVSISGDKVLVGASRDSTGAISAGSVYLFDATTGTLLHTFNNPTPATYSNFGYSISLSGDRVLIGAGGGDCLGVTFAGSAYLYDATNGVLLQTFNNPTPVSDDHFGDSVSISGDKVLIGARYDDTGAYNTGSAYLFDATTGALLRTFNNPTPASHDNFGFSLSLSGDRVLIGSPWDDAEAYEGGLAYLYDATTGALLHTISNPTPANYDIFGISVFLSGDKVLIGATSDDTGANSAGSVYLFDATTGTLLHTFNNPTPATGDNFGGAISLSVDKILIGAPYNSNRFSHDGSVYLYLPQPDTDDDGMADNADNCPGVANTDQANADGDGFGNACDTTPNGDTDNDGVDNLTDNCPINSNTTQTDNDADGLGNACDTTPNGDTDSDGVDNLADNCPTVANPGQEDNDADGIGNACDLTPPQEVAALVDLVEVFNLQQGIANNLDAKLDAALNALSDVNTNNNQAAINSLQAFISAVEAQRGNKITNEQADTLVAAAQTIIDSLSL